MKKILAVLENLATALGPAHVASSDYFLKTNALLFFNISTYTSDYLWQKNQQEQIVHME